MAVSAPARHLLQRLLVLGLAACSSGSTTTGGTGASTTGAGGEGAGAAGAGSAGSSAGGAAGVSTAGGAVGAPQPTSACHAGKACAPEDTCSFASGGMTGTFAVATWCACEAGVFACPVNPTTDGGLPVVLGCVYGAVNAACPTTEDAAVGAAIAESHTGGCPAFVLDPTAAPTPETSSDGTPACCYLGHAGPCKGRPMILGGRLAVARLIPGAANGWAQRASGG